MKTLHFLTYLFFSTICSGQIITTIAGKGSFGFSGEGGPAINAEFSFLAGITTDRSGNIFVADFDNNVIQKIDEYGTLTRYAGNGTTGNSGDGGPATNASLNLYVLVGLTTDTLGNLYITGGSQIRKVTTSGIISTFAGTGIYGSSGDGGPATAATFMSPTGLCFDKEGSLYIADEQASLVRKINTLGVISTIAGSTFGFSGDGGPATNAQLKWPNSVAIDDMGYLYINDFFNDRVRRIDLSGKINTIAGGGNFLVVCQGCPAVNLQLNGNTGLAVDKNSNIYVSVTVDPAVHKIKTDGNAYTIAGTGIAGFSGDGDLATAAHIRNPTMICLDPDGNLLIADKGNGRIRKVWIGTAYTPSVSLGSSLLYAYPNPAVNKSFTCKAITADTSESADLVITDVLGRLVSTALITTNTATDISLPVPAGMYFLSATTRSGYKMSAKIIVQ